MANLIDVARRMLGRDVRDALVATPLRKLLVTVQWPVTAGAAFALGAHTPSWVWPAAVAAQLAVTVWVGDRLADRDALLSEYLAEADSDAVEQDAVGR